MNLKNKPHTLPYNFLGLSENCSFEESAVTILPVPYERTVSFGTGTSKGPQSIIMASRCLELYDEELACEPCEVGIHTMDESEYDVDPEEMVNSVSDLYTEILERDKFIVTVGGEHSVTNGPVRSLHEKYGDFSVFSIDAHCDLRDSYGGTSYSHACVMRRAAELDLNIVQAGIRSLSSEEAEFLSGNDNINVFFAKDIAVTNIERIIGEILASLKDRVYISVDLDGFDPSLIPSTGTPEPGGLNWYQVLSLLQGIFKMKDVIGMDVVELAPAPGNVSPDVLAAKLIYKSIGYKYFLK